MFLRSFAFDAIPMIITGVLIQVHSGGLQYPLHISTAVDQNMRPIFMRPFDFVDSPNSSDGRITYTHLVVAWARWLTVGLRLSWRRRAATLGDEPESNRDKNQSREIHLNENGIGKSAVFDLTGSHCSLFKVAPRSKCQIFKYDPGTPPTPGPPRGQRHHHESAMPSPERAAEDKFAYCRWLILSRLTSSSSRASRFSRHEMSLGARSRNMIVKRTRWPPSRVK